MLFPIFGCCDVIGACHTVSVERLLPNDYSIVYP